MDGRCCSAVGQIIDPYHFPTKIKAAKMPPFLLPLAFLRCKTKTANHLVCGLDVSDMIRTRGLLIRSQTLYPAELHSHIRFEQNL